MCVDIDLNHTTYTVSADGTPTAAATRKCKRLGGKLLQVTDDELSAISGLELEALLGLETEPNPNPNPVLTLTPTPTPTPTPTLALTPTPTLTLTLALTRLPALP